jgi:hypothetical protein
VWYQVRWDVNMANRLAKWVLFTVLFAILPITISLLLTYLTGSEKNIYDFSTEVLFFTIMIGSVSLSDLVGLNRIVKDVILTLFIGFFILMVLYSSIMYGSLLYANIMVLEVELMKERIFLISSLLALLSCALGTVIQVLLNKTGATK